MKILDGWRARRRRESTLRGTFWNGLLTFVLTVLFLPVAAVILIAVMAILMLPATFSSDNGVEEAEMASFSEMITDPDTAPRGALVIQFRTNDTKAEWVGEVTTRFNQGDHRTPGGKGIFVHAIQSDSGDFLPWLVEGRMRPVAWSPGTIAWVNEANVRWLELHGRPLVRGHCPEVVYTAIGIGMWRRPWAGRTRPLAGTTS